MMDLKSIAWMFFCGILALGLYGCQPRFAASVRRTATETVRAADICTYRAGTVVDCVSLRKGSTQLANVLSSLAKARATLAPGKVQIIKERVLRIQALDDAKCYRLIEFSGFPDEYLNDVAMNSDCTQVTAYRSGYAVIPRIE